MKLVNNSHTGGTVGFDWPLGQEIENFGRHGDWLRAALDSRRLSLYQRCNFAEKRIVLLVHVRPVLRLCLDGECTCT